ncbi:MAG: CinA family protein [Clostridia bacterium]|nr:CinA family protein [Clostridia bacterium]
MKFAGIVLRNVRNPLSSVEYGKVIDTLLSGGVFLREIAMLSYDASSDLSTAIVRLGTEYDGVFLICDPVLIPAAKKILSGVTDVRFQDEYHLETEGCFFAVLPDGDRGAETVRSRTMAFVDGRRQNSYSSVVVRMVSPPSDKLNKALKRAFSVAGGKLDLNVSEKYGCARIEIIYDAATPKMIADEVLRILATELDDYIYAVKDTSLAERLVEALQLHRMRVSTAESFTGGGVGRAIVRVPGASSVFFEGLNTYDNQSKRERLGVSELTLMHSGAVSDETAYEMAAGLIAGGNCDVAIATTGIAGPKSDNTDKPVGLCFIAVGTKDRVRVFRFRLSGDRETITETAINLALFHAYKEIK